MDDFSHIQKLILYATGQMKGGVMTETHMQKLIFLVLKALDIDPESLGYYPHNFGPFSLAIKETSDDLTSSGYLQIKEKSTVVNETVLGNINLIEPKIEFDRFKIREVADFMDDLTRDEVLLHTYIADPHYAKNSKILNNVLNKRVGIATDMFRKEKVSVSAAAELAGLSVLKFQEILKEYWRARN